MLQGISSSPLTTVRGPPPCPSPRPSRCHPSTRPRSAFHRRRRRPGRVDGARRVSLGHESADELERVRVPERNLVPVGDREEVAVWRQRDRPRRWAGLRRRRADEGGQTRVGLQRGRERASGLGRGLCPVRLDGEKERQVVLLVADSRAWAASWREVAIRPPPPLGHAAAPPRSAACGLRCAATPPAQLPRRPRRGGRRAWRPLPVRAARRAGAGVLPRRRGRPSAGRESAPPGRPPRPGSAGRRATVLARARPAQVDEARLLGERGQEVLGDCGLRPGPERPGRVVPGELAVGDRDQQPLGAVASSQVSTSRATQGDSPSPARRGG